MSTFRSLAFLGLVSVSAAALAGDLSVAGMTPGKNHVINIAYFSSSIAVYAGPQSASYDGDAFEGYCVDLDHAQYPPVTFDVTPTAADGFTTYGARVAQLVNQYGLGVSTADQGAALQLAIWDVLVDGGDGLAVGNFKASGLNTGTTAFFSSYLGDPLTGASSLATIYNPTSHGAGGNVYQALIGPGGDHIANAVPEPASMIALGLGGMALIRRRRKQA
ncbi:PEP-CTERM sorting domain-containing protein [bacterium]|nr:MAG: PEP-CTERM sorting domain-containing protein [bacterium]